MRPLMPPVQTPDNLFHDGNPLTGELGTIVDAEHLNNEQAAIRDTQSELIAILTAAAMEPASTAGQLLAALNKLYAPFNDTLGALSTLVGGANKLPYFTAADAAALTALSSIGRDIIGKATVADVLTYLQLQETVKEAAGSLQKGNNFSDVENIVAARLNLQLGDSAILNVGKVYGSVASGDSTFGIAQQYKDVTSSRVLGVTYTNTTSRAIMILVTLDVPLNGRRDAVVGGVITSSFASSNSASQIGTVYAVVPPGVTYSIAASIIPGGSLIRWMELSQ